MKETIIHIVNRLAPALCGVGDYAKHLSDALRETQCVDTYFIVCNKGSEAIEMGGRYQIDYLEKPNKKFLLQALNQAHKFINTQENSLPTILLQLSPYGYERNGCPFWLLNGLKEWKLLNPEIRIIIMFHELFAFGPPWKKAFWVSPFQRIVTSNLTRLSDVAVTSIQSYASKLKEWGKSKEGRVNISPVFSNIGEPGYLSQLWERKKRLIIFGQKYNRINAYKNSFDKITEACKQLGITEIIDIGTKLDIDISINNVKIREMGRLPESEISSLMCESVAGYIDYPSEYLAKSTIFAAYCAHGMIPLTGEIKSSEADGIYVGKEYWVPDNAHTLDLSRGQTIADNARKWYSNHRLELQAAMYADKIKQRN